MSDGFDAFNGAQLTASIIVTAFLPDLQLIRSDDWNPFWNLQLDSSCYKYLLVMRSSMDCMGKTVALAQFPHRE